MRLTIAYNLGTHNNTYQQHVEGTHNKVLVGSTQYVYDEYLLGVHVGVTKPVTLW